MFFLYLIRHGQAECNVKNIYPGKNCITDVSLTDLGKQQAELTAAAFHELLKKNQRRCEVYHSPSKRVFETAKIIAKEIGAKSYIDEGFWMRDQGIVTGLSYDQVRVLYPDYYIQMMDNINFTLPGAETRKAEYKRVVKSWLNIKKTITAEETDIVIVAHDTTIAHLCHFLLNVPFEGFFRFFPIEHCSITRFQFGRTGYGDRACLNYFNNTQHFK